LQSAIDIFTLVRNWILSKHTHTGLEGGYCEVSVLFDRIQKARAGQERELADPIAAPPGDPLDPSKLPEPLLALEGDTHIPSGELHTIAAKE
jgi:hypothetical protein